MAGPKKKKAVQAESDSENEQSDQEEMMDQDTIMADFEGRNPDGGDYHGIQQLLKQLFLKAHVNLSQLSDIIIAQQGLGSVLKQSLDDDDDDDEEDVNNDVFGVTTIINLTGNKEKECVQQLYGNLQALAEKHAEDDIEKRINSLLSDSDKKIGLILNERFLNIPAKIADPLMDSLLNEVTRTGKKNPSFNFDYYIMICKTYKQAKSKKDEGTIFINAEEEIFANNSEVSFEFSVANETDTGVGGAWTEEDKQMIPHRRVVIINSNKFPEIVQNVKSFVSQ